MEEPKSTGAMRRTDLFYFSGTGNSLFVANELAKKIPGSTVRPIISLLRQGMILTDAALYETHQSSYGFSLCSSSNLVTYRRSQIKERGKKSPRMD